MSMNALKLAESWKIYIDTFTDLCDIDKVPIEKRRTLLLLLSGINILDHPYVRVLYYVGYKF
jgi:hypothetical protein